MKVRAYVLFVAVALLAVSAGTKNAKPTVGINPGDFAPRIESLGTESNFSFQNHSPKNSYSKFANYNYFLCFFKFRLFKLNIFFCTYINIKLILNIQTIN